MIKTVEDRVWAFDMEWVPDPLAGQLVYGIEPTVTRPEDVLSLMWGEGGATEDDPTPFLKLAMCRIVSVAAVERLAGRDGEVIVRLLSLPRDPDEGVSATERREVDVIGPFLDALGERRPQLVGYNSVQSDLKILIQRGIILGLRAEGFCQRPAKPWEGVDYFARGSDWNVDLKDVIAGWGRQSVPSLHELAVQSGVPGKMDVDGNAVARLWLDGELGRIVRYNEYDALTTYLVWLRVAHFAGHFTTERYEIEQQLVRDMLERESVTERGAHLTAYLEEWDRLTAAIRGRKGDA